MNNDLISKLLQSALVNVFKLLLLALFCASCTSKYKAELNFNPQERLRVAILPFAAMQRDGSFADEDPNLLLDKVGVVSSQLKESPAAFLERLVTSELQRTNLDIIAPAFVDAQLSHGGFYSKAKFPGAVPFDVPKIFSQDPKTLCETILYCDALLYGKVLRWERGYYGVQSASEVALEVTLVSARDNSVLFRSLGEDAESRGILKIPTGISNIFLEPIKGLSSDIITDLSRSMVRQMLKSLHSDQDKDNKNSPLPVILALTHDAPASGILSTGQSLTVLALGSPREVATFSLTGVAEHMPMEEHEEGHYVGHYTPVKGDAFAPSIVTVTLSDNSGRSITRPIPSPLVSLPGRN